MPDVANAEKLGFTLDRRRHSWFVRLAPCNPADTRMPDRVERLGDYGIMATWLGPNAMDRAREFSVLVDTLEIPNHRGRCVYSPPIAGMPASYNMRYHLTGNPVDQSPQRSIFSPVEAAVTVVPTSTLVKSDELVTVCPTY